MVIRKLTNKIIALLGKENYSIDSNISNHNLSIILSEKLLQIIRGLILKIMIKKSRGIVFVGRNVKVKHCNLIKTGKTLIIGDNVFINALSVEGIQFGNNVSIHRNSIIDCTGGIRYIGIGLIIGNNVGFSPNCYVQVRGRVIIGNNVIFGPNVSIFSESHIFSDPEKFINEQGETRKGVVIEDGVWVGADVTILDGVTIGSNSVIAAKSLVNKSVPAFSIVGGIPAKILKYRNGPNEK